jgi:hypothetical protein
MRRRNGAEVEWSLFGRNGDSAWRSVRLGCRRATSAEFMAEPMLGGERRCAHG